MYGATAMRKVLRALVAPAVLASYAACSSDKPPPQTPVPPAFDAGTDAGAYDAASDAGTGASDAAAEAGPAVTGNILEQAGDSVVDLGAAAMAKTSAPGMDPEGAPGRATLKEGEHFNMLVTMQPGRCYTIIGFSPDGQVSQLDLKLLAPPLYNVEAGHSGKEKNKPILGKGKSAQCPVLPIALPYKIDAVATKGQGRIGVFVYAKSK